MGEVWRARHRLLRRDAAVKLVSSGPAGSAPAQCRAAHLAQRFELEAQAIASLRSPHTVALYDFGAVGERSLYYVMELSRRCGCAKPWSSSTGRSRRAE